MTVVLREPLPLAVAAGDPLGVGPLVAVRALRDAPPAGGAVLLGDAAQLRALAERFGLPVGQGACVRIVGVGQRTEPARCQYEALRRGARMAARGEAGALVTAPVSKAAIATVQPDFRGQTEWLAGFAGIAPDAVTMLFLGARLRVGLVTTHLPLQAVAAAITAERVRRTVRHLAEAIRRLEAREAVSLAVCGLDPHLGEGGLIGRLDGEVVAPALEAERRAQDEALRIEHLPAETAFRRAADGDVDGVVAMYHDQGTVPSKLLDWGRALNVTWGLPFVRTSPDHGVGYEAVRRGEVDASGMTAAVRLASRLAGREVSR